MTAPHFDDADESSVAPHPADERLNTLRVRAVIAERRHAMRRRTYHWVLTFAAAGSAVQVGRFAVDAVVAHRTLTAIAAMIVVAGCAAAVWQLWPRPTPPPPAAKLPPPDFTGLGDGSHFVRNLEQIHNDTPE